MPRIDVSIRNHARGPRLRRARHRILHRLVMFAPLHAAEQFGQAVVAEVQRRLEERCEEVRGTRNSLSAMPWAIRELSCGQTEPR